MIDTYLQWAGLPREALPLLHDWEVVPCLRNGEIGALAVIKGTEIHFACAPGQRHQLIQRSRTREFLAPLFERWGFLTTRSVASDFGARDFLARLGFAHTFYDGQFNHYMLSALPFGKEA